MSGRPPKPYPDPKPLTGLVSYQLKRAYLASNAAYAAALEPLGLKPGHYGLLQTIAEDEGLAQKDAAAAIGLDKSTVTPILTELETRGWIERRLGADKRERRLYLCKAGRDALEGLHGLIAEHERLITQELSPVERAFLTDLLIRVREAALKNGPKK